MILSFHTSGGQVGLRYGAARESLRLRLVFFNTDILDIQGLLLGSVVNGLELTRGVSFLGCSLMVNSKAVFTFFHDMPSLSNLHERLCSSTNSLLDFPRFTLR